jgi:coproporphyrinogen III oxidase
MPVDRRVGNYFDNTGNFLRRVARWSGPTLYATGGEAATPASFGLGTIVVASFTPALDAAGVNTRVVAWNSATQKVQWFSAPGAEVANGTDLSGFSCQMEIIGS